MIGAASAPRPSAAAAWAMSAIPATLLPISNRDHSPFTVGALASTKVLNWNKSATGA